MGKKSNLPAEAYKNKNVELDERSFRRFFYTRVFDWLCSAGQAFSYIQAPPHARDANGDTDWTRFDWSSLTAHYFDTRIGSTRMIDIAHRIYAIRRDINGCEDLSQIQSTSTHRTFTFAFNPGTMFVLAVHSPFAAPCMRKESVFTMPEQLMDLSGLDAVMGLPEFLHATSEAAERTAWRLWLRDFTQRRRKAWLVVLFFKMIAANPDISTRTVINAFPWLPEALRTLGVKEQFIAEAMLPWRGHDGQFTDFIVDEWGDVNRTLAEVGVKEIRPALTEMCMAQSVYPKTQARLRAPHNLIFASMPLASHDDIHPAVTAVWPDPAWYTRFSALFSAGINYNDESRALLTRMSTASILAP